MHLLALVLVISMPIIALAVPREKTQGKSTECVYFASGTTAETDYYWAWKATMSTRATTSPRLKEANATTGEGMLEAFGTKYLPNAYALYQDKREKAKELEVTYKENFPRGKDSDVTGGGLHDKIAKAVAKAVSEMDRRHDELCHFYLLHKVGAVTDAELASIDQSKICIMLPDTGNLGYISRHYSYLPSDLRTFAAKYLPVTLSGYDRLITTQNDEYNTYDALCKDARTMDAVLANVTLTPLRLHCEEIKPMLDKIYETFKKQKLLHAVEEVTSEQLATIDQKIGLEIQAFEKRSSVKDFSREWLATNWEKLGLEQSLPAKRLFELDSTMIQVPHRHYSICKTKVTQALWYAVMGKYPPPSAWPYESAERGLDKPAFKISWIECQKFITELNARPEIKASGFTYRLPTPDVVVLGTDTKRFNW